MKRFFIFGALFTAIPCAQADKLRKEQKPASSDENRIVVYVDFAYDRGRAAIFTLPGKKYSDEALKKEIAQRCSIPTDENGRLDHIQHQIEKSSPSTLSYIVY